MTKCKPTLWPHTTHLSVLSPGSLAGLLALTVAHQGITMDKGVKRLLRGLFGLLVGDIQSMKATFRGHLSHRRLVRVRGCGLHISLLAAAAYFQHLSQLFARHVHFPKTRANSRFGFANVFSLGSKKSQGISQISTGRIYDFPASRQDAEEKWTVLNFLTSFLEIASFLEFADLFLAPISQNRWGILNFPRLLAVQTLQPVCGVCGRMGSYVARRIGRAAPPEVALASICGRFRRKV
jgi:hypothetical protein